jgi:hypothetical protein
MFPRIHRRTVGAVAVCLCAGQLLLHAQEFKLFDRTVQVHAFASQAFVYTNENNWLTMNTSGGSGAFTDFGLNMSTRIVERLRVGAQVYDRNLGQLGQYHPSLDWAVADYRFQSWLGFRGGKVKTTLGLFNDSQDQDFLHTFALLPQSVYPTDLRDATIAHVGGDLYGTVSLARGFGDLSYTAYAGHRSDSIYSGYPYLLSGFGTHFTSFGGLQYGGDLRWNPWMGLVLGASRLDQDTRGRGTALNPANFAAPRISYSESSRADWTNQYFGEYTVGKARIDSEYRRYVRDQLLFGGNSRNLTDVRGWYVLGSYRAAKRLDLGAYYSHYSIISVIGGALAHFVPSQTDTSLPANHIYDKVVTGRILLRKYWDAKIEGHFMDGYGSSTYPDGFYLQVNANGFKPKTNALVVKTSFSF